MLTVNKLIARGHGLAAVLLKRAAVVELDWDVRQKSRFDATDSGGRGLAVFLPRGTAVRGGDVLVADDGSLVRVRAAPQPVLVVRHCPDHGAPSDLLRGAYHLGNRHVAVELQPDHLKIEPDHVLATMLRRLHLVVSEAWDAFEPENGAYEAAAPATPSGDSSARPDHSQRHPGLDPDHGRDHHHGRGCSHGGDHDPG